MDGDGDRKKEALKYKMELRLERDTWAKRMRRKAANETNKTHGQLPSGSHRSLFSWQRNTTLSAVITYASCLRLPAAVYLLVSQPITTLPLKCIHTGVTLVPVSTENRRLLSEADGKWETSSNISKCIVSAAKDTHHAHTDVMLFLLFSLRPRQCTDRPLCNLCNSRINTDRSTLGSDWTAADQAGKRVTPISKTKPLLLSKINNTACSLTQYTCHAYPNECFGLQWKNTF